MADLDPTTSRVMEDRLMPAARNLLGNRGNSEVQQLLAAGENATPAQKEKVVEKYLAPFFGEGSEHGDILLDEILKIASDQAKLDAVERSLSGSPVNESIDFDPRKFLEKAARQMTGDYKGANQHQHGTNKDMTDAMLAPATGLPKRIMDETTGTVTVNKEIEIQVPGVPIPPPPLFVPQAENMKAPREQPREQPDEYIGDQLDGSKAQSQPTGSSSSPQGKTMRDAKKEGLNKHSKREKESSSRDEVAQNVQEQQKFTVEEILRGAAEAAEAARVEAENAKKKPTGSIQKLKHPAAIAGLMTGAATLTIGSILGLDYGINTLFS